MNKSDKILALLGGLVFLLLNYPLLQIANQDALAAGVPLLPLYILGVWLLAILGLYLAGRRLSSPGEPDRKDNQR